MLTDDLQLPVGMFYNKRFFLTVLFVLHSSLEKSLWCSSKASYWPCALNIFPHVVPP
jgi:hypothetical protein